MGIYHVVSKKKINYKYKDLIFILLKINTWTKISMNKQKLNMRKLQLRSSNSSNKGTFGNCFGNSAYLLKKKKKAKEADNHHVSRRFHLTFHLFVIVHKQG